MATYFDKVLYLYPNIQGVSYWYTQYDGTPWNDLYDGLVWENKDMPKPLKIALDELDDALVEKTLSERKEVQRKKDRDLQYKSDLSILSGFDIYIKTHIGITYSQYLDYLESLSETISG